MSDALATAVAEALAAVAGLADEPARRDALARELLPFAEAAARCDGSLTPEARSLAWLFAWRAGDQHVSPLAVTTALRAWRDVCAHPSAAAHHDHAVELALDAYAKAREERAAATLRRAFTDALAAELLAPHVVLVAAAGPLDAESARALVERASPLLLRHDAKALVLHVAGLAARDADVLAELHVLLASAAMVGARALVVADDALWAALCDVDPKAARPGRCDHLAAALEALARVEGVPLVGAEGWLGRAHALLAGAVRTTARGR